MKVVFIADFAAIQPESIAKKSKSDDDNEITVYRMVKKCILQILIYLSQSSSSSHAIHVGFKCCDSRACDSSSEYHIPIEIANSKRILHEFMQNEHILKIFSEEYKGTHKKRDNKNKNLKTPILSTSRSYSRSQPHTVTTPNTNTALQLAHNSGLSQIVIALSQCLKQYEWTDTLLTNQCNDDHDTIEPQMIFILSTVPNDDSIKSIPQWNKYIKILSTRSISLHFVHIPSSFNASLIPFGANDDTELKYIQSMDVCLRQLSQGSIGCIPMTLLWMAPILNLNHPFIQMFKHNGSLQISQYEKWLQSTVRWNGNIVMTSGAHTGTSLSINCDLVSMEYSNNRSKKYNRCNSASVCNDIYGILHKNIQCLHMEGMLSQDCLNKMDPLPYISLVICPKQSDNTNQETQRFQQLFVSSTCNKAYFVVRFSGDENGNNEYNMKGIMYSVIPSFVILRIYVGMKWNTPSRCIHDKLQQLTIHNGTSDVTNAKHCIESMLNRDKFMTKIRNSKHSSRHGSMKQKMKRSLKMLYAAQINRQKQEEKVLKEEESKKKRASSAVVDCNDIDLSHLELSLKLHSHKPALEQYDALCASFTNIYKMLLSKTSLKSQHLFAFIDNTYKSLLRLCMTLFNEQIGRRKVKEFLRKNVFIDPCKYTSIRNGLNLNQKLFDIKLQILLLLEYGLMHFKNQQRVDPLAKFKQFSVFFERLYYLEINDETSFKAFRSYIINIYEVQLPKTFAKYNENHSEDEQEQQDEQDVNVADPLSHCKLPQKKASIATAPRPNQKRKRKRKRRYSEITPSESIQASSKRFKKTRTQRTSKQQLHNVIITPMLAAKTNRNQKLVSNTSQRTMTRSQRGGAIRSGKRPLRLVLADNSNSKDTQERKKRKIAKRQKKPALSKASSHVFSSNQNRNPLTNSAIKKRSTQWDAQLRIQKSFKHRSRRQRKSKKTPPLKRCMTESNLNNPLFQSMPLDLIRTQSMMHMRRNIDNLDDEDVENLRGQSLPTQSNTIQTETTQSCMSEATSTSPLWPPLSRTQSLTQMDCTGSGYRQSFNLKPRIPLGTNTNQRNGVFDEINKAMDDNQDWMTRDTEALPQHMVKQVFIHRAIKPAHFSAFVAASNTNSIGPSTPSVKIRHCLNTFRFGNEVIFDSGGSNSKRESFIPETPELMTCDGNGASNIQSHCKINMRQTLCTEAQDVANNETIRRKMSF